MRAHSLNRAEHGNALKFLLRRRFLDHTQALEDLVNVFTFWGQRFVRSDLTDSIIPL
jgi:hypothetical protein